MRNLKKRRMISSAGQNCSESTTLAEWAAALEAEDLLDSIIAQEGV